MRRILLSTITLIFLQTASAQEKSVDAWINTLKERIVLMGYAQTGYTYDSDPEAKNTFDVKRIIFMADGKLTDQWSCYFMYDFKGGGNLLEVYTEYRFLPGLSARMGQFKTPYSIENPLSPTTVELIDCYSQAVSYLAGINNSDPLYGGTSGRDIGLMIHGELLNQYVYYHLAVMNGQGINIKDKNDQKDIVGSLMVNPLSWLSVGGSFIKGKGNAVAESPYNTIGTDENYDRNRWAAGGIVETKPLSLRSEYLAGKDGRVRSNGFYATANYHVCPRFDIIASYDYINRDTSVSDKQTHYVAGVQYWFYPRCRLQAQYTYRDKQHGDNSHCIQTQIQVRF